MTMSTRGKGAVNFLVGVAGTLAVWLLMLYLRRQGYVPSSLFTLIPLAIPGVYALNGLLEMIAGVPSAKIASQWDSLAGWQRGVLGLLVVALAIVLALAGMVLFA